MKRIEIEAINFEYKNRTRVFTNFSLSMNSESRKGKIIAIMGSSGAGKSTLLKLLLGIEKVSSGKISMLPENPIVSYVPQEPVLFEHLSIKKNARYFQFAGAYKKYFDEGLYNELAKELGLQEILNDAKLVTEISGGQKQRLSLLRALSINPHYLLLDEPCNGLDAEVKKSFLNKLREVAEKYSLFILYITHQKLEAQLIADEVVYLVQNKQSLTVSDSVKAPVFEFMTKPPLLEAAHIFRFPDVKILGVIKSESGEIDIANNILMATNFWLLRDEDLLVSENGQWLFEIVSQSSIFSVIRHHESGTEWIISSRLIEKFSRNEIVKISFTDKYIEYDKTGKIIH